MEQSFFDTDQGKMRIPDVIKKYVGKESYIIDRTGMSRSGVLLFADMVLKIQDSTAEAENECLAMRWLEGRLSVPRVLAHERMDGKSYLLMSKAEGKMACDDCFMRDPERLTSILAQALQELWHMDISDCPFDLSLDKKLAAAAYNVKNHLVDTGNVEPDTFGPGAFKDPEELLQWLIEHRPPEELVLSHGDFCLPNIFFNEAGRVSFIDLGRTGIADRWQDISICYRSLLHNYSGKYSGKAYPNYDPMLLFEKLGLAPDWEKIRYYCLLDELF